MRKTAHQMLREALEARGHRVKTTLELRPGDRCKMPSGGPVLTVERLEPADPEVYGRNVFVVRWRHHPHQWGAANTGTPESIWQLADHAGEAAR